MGVILVLDKSSYIGKIVFICNPVAGTGKSRIVMSAVQHKLDSIGASYSVLYSEHPGHGTMLAETAAGNGARVVCAVGGDGTVREVALGLADSSVPLGILPAGTGNDFIRCLHIPSDPMEALEIILSGFSKEVNFAYANGIPYINVAGFGFDVDVLDAVEISKTKYKNGRIAYLAGLLGTIRHRQLRNVTYTVDDGFPVTVHALMIAAANGTHIGGGISIAPNAMSDDNYLDFTIIHDVVSLKDVAIMLPALLSGNILKKKKYVTSLRGKVLHAECIPESRMQIDGERMLGTPVTFMLSDTFIRVLVPFTRG